MAEDKTTGKTRSRAGLSERLIKPKPNGAAVQVDDTVTDEMETGSAETSVAHSPRFHFFLIDCGWDGPVPNVIRNNLAMITHLQNSDPLFVLSREQSDEMLKKYPHLIGKDPILLARDLHASRVDGKTEYHGFHLNLGLTRDPNKALEVLRAFLSFLAQHRKGGDIEKHVREQLHRDGIKGAIEVLRVGAESVVSG